MYRNKRYRSYDDAECRIRLHVRPYFGRLRARDLTAAHCEKYVEKRKNEPDSRGLNKKLREGEERVIRHATDATINRELSLLRKAFNEARREPGRRIQEIVAHGLPKSRPAWKVIP